MGQRIDLQTLLRTLLGTDNVYFQPPEDVKMVYPAIVYKRDTARTAFADGKPYRYKKRYQIIAISRDPDDVLHDKLAALPMCTFSRYYAAENLHHDVFNLFF